MSLEQYVDWDEVEFLVGQLHKKISKLPRSFSSITTLSRGGLIPSRLLADHLGIKKIHVDKKRISSDSLFVDDIFDTGDSFKKVIPHVDFPDELIYATLFARKGKKYPKQLVYAKKTDSDSYVVFPWDKLEYKKSLK